jgi:hypothetical protein
MMHTVGGRKVVRTVLNAITHYLTFPSALSVEEKAILESFKDGTRAQLEGAEQTVVKGHKVSDQMTEIRTNRAINKALDQAEKEVPTPTPTPTSTPTPVVK